MLELSKNSFNTQTYASDVLNIVIIEYFTRFIIAAAAAGYAAQALKILTESTAAIKLLPLVVRLKIFLEEERPLVAQEVFEVGKDVADRIRTKQAELANRCLLTPH